MTKFNVPAAKVHFPEEDIPVIQERIAEVLRSGQLTLGKYCKEFEEKFRALTQTRFAVGVNSGTSSLEIILRSIGVEGKSVIVPTNTFFATPAAVIHAGGRPIFADSADNLCVDADSVNALIAKDTKAIVAVHIAGIIPPQIRVLREICDDKKIPLIEDAAHAHGSMLAGRPAGSFGDAASFSFYPTKSMTSAEGGMIVTNSEEIYKKALVLRDQGKANFNSNYHTDLGYNWRMSEPHAIIGLAQFARIQQFISHRRDIAAHYDKNLKKSGLKPLRLPSEVVSNYYKYCAFMPDGVDRVALKKELKERFGVSMSGEVYEIPCHMQPVFKRLPGVDGLKLPRAEALCAQHICLPISAVTTREEAQHVIDSLTEVLG